MTAPSQYIPEDWDAMLQAVYDWARTAVPAGVTVVWSQQNAPSIPTPFVRLNLITPPIPQGQHEQRNTGSGVLVSSVLPSTLYRVTINGTNFDFTTGLSPTALQIRNALMTEIDAGSEPVTTQAVRDDLFTLLVDPGETITVSVTTNLKQKIAHQYLGEATATFSVDVLVNPQANDAVAVAVDLQNSLEVDSFLENLRVAGWAVISLENIRSPDTVVGAAWEGRAGFDLRLRCRSRRLDVIDFLEFTGVGTGVVGSIAP